ncbi:hypothetical protein QQX98_005874 [Neonectria punicea]|uniref:Uncharacterized protein n=1 Tax=Neonectria punicea TaxID=979145 RepID=A0ABR1H2W3_9HYPO
MLATQPSNPPASIVTLGGRPSNQTSGRRILSKRPTGPPDVGGLFGHRRGDPSAKATIGKPKAPTGLFEWREASEDSKYGRPSQSPLASGLLVRPRNLSGLSFGSPAPPTLFSSRPPPPPTSQSAFSSGPSETQPTSSLLGSQPPRADTPFVPSTVIFTAANTFPSKPRGLSAEKLERIQDLKDLSLSLPADRHLRGKRGWPSWKQYVLASLVGVGCFRGVVLTDAGEAKLLAQMHGILGSSAVGIVLPYYTGSESLKALFNRFD